MRMGGGCVRGRDSVGEGRGEKERGNGRRREREEQGMARRRRLREESGRDLGLSGEAGHGCNPPPPPARAAEWWRGNFSRRRAGGGGRPLKEEGERKARQGKERARTCMRCGRVKEN